MGIAQYFSTIVKTHPEIFKGWDASFTCDYLYFDFNCLVYQVYNLIIANEREKLMTMTQTQIDDKIIDDVITYMKKIIDEIAKPTKLVYIGVDGVVPRAKMIQQRFRRFSGWKQSAMEKEVKAQFGIEEKSIWNRNSITPGTVFMKKLSDKIIKAIKQKKITSLRNIEFVVSDASVPGEGEHKLIPYLRKIGKLPDEKIVIYGMDADLIMLSLSTFMDNIYLLREKDNVRSQFGNVVESSFGLLNVDTFRKKIVAGFDINVPGISENQLFSDYVFIGFFLGNDFVHCIPSLEIRFGGYDRIMGIYRRILTRLKRGLVQLKFPSKSQTNGTNGGKNADRNKQNYANMGNAISVSINFVFFRQLLEDLSRQEEKNLQYLHMKHTTRITTRNAEDDIGKALEEITKLPLNPKYKDKVYPVDYSQPNWKIRYYEETLDIKPQPEDEYVMYVDGVCKNFLEAIMFSTKYYYSGVPSWTWFYRFPVSPMMSDVLDYYNRVVKNVNDIQLDMGNPVKPIQQLMMVSPPQSKELLPSAYQKLMVEVESPIIEYYPIDFEYFVFNKFNLYQGEPILPTINQNHVIRVLEERENELTKDEKERNTMGKIIIMKV